MNKNTKLWLGIGAVIVVLLGLYFALGRDSENVDTEVGEIQNAEVYRNSDYGIAFEYPRDYEVIEVTEKASKRHSIIIQSDSTKVPKDGEGPTAITVDVFPNSSVEDPYVWVQQNTAVSNFELASSDVEDIKVDGVSAITYSWDGLYQGRSIIFYSNGNVFLVSGTYLKTSDDVYKNFDRIVASMELDK